MNLVTSTLSQVALWGTSNAPVEGDLKEMEYILACGRGTSSVVFSDGRERQRDRGHVLFHKSSVHDITDVKEVRGQQGK